MERTMQAVSIVINHWIQECTTIKKDKFISKLEDIYRDRYDVYLLQEKSRAIYNNSDASQRVRLEQIATQHALSMIEHGTRIERCVCCGNRRRLIVESDAPTSEGPYNFVVSAECETWRCPNYEIYVF